MGIKRPFEYENIETELHPNQRIARLLPDWHVRRRNGQHQLYICMDKRRIHLIAAQKLNLLASHISKLAGDDRSECITSVSLCKLLNESKVTLNGGYSKMRWAVRALPLDEGGLKEFESSRKGFERATILGSRGTLHLKLDDSVGS